MFGHTACLSLIKADESRGRRTVLRRVWAVTSFPFPSNTSVEKWMPSSSSNQARTQQAAQFFGRNRVVSAHVVRDAMRWPRLEAELILVGTYQPAMGADHEDVDERGRV
jgi:hypothetical protein